MPETSSDEIEQRLRASVKLIKRYRDKRGKKNRIIYNYAVGEYMGIKETMYFTGHGEEFLKMLKRTGEPEFPEMVTLFAHLVPGMRRF